MKTVCVLPLLWLLSAGCKQDEVNTKSTLPSELEQIAVYATLVPEPSGLAYCKKNNSLLTVSDANSTLYELDLGGNILRSQKLSSPDMEGVAVSESGDTLYIAAEGSQSIDTYLSDGTKIGSMSVPVAIEAAHSVEGVARGTNGRLYVVNEKRPCMLLEYSHGVEVSRMTLTRTADLSDIFYEERADCLWIVSDESAKVVRLSLNGELLSEYAIPFVKGEGITVTADKVYIINDADGKLYVFKKP